MDIGAWELDYFTIVSWYWEYYELDIRAWELDIRALELDFFTIMSWYWKYYGLVLGVV